MKKLTDYIKDPHTPNLFDAFGVPEERVNEILDSLCTCTEQAQATEKTNQLYALKLMEESGFVLQNDHEAAFIFYTLFKAAQNLRFASKLEGVIQGMEEHLKVTLDQEQTPGPVN